MTVSVGWLALPILLPLLGAVLAVLVGGGRAGRAIASLAGLAVLGVALDLSAVLLREGPLRAPVGGWPEPLGISLVADGPGVLMLTAAALVGTLVSLHALASGPAPAPSEAPPRAEGVPEAHVATARWFPPLWLLAWTGINVVFLSGDLFNLYVGLEVLGLAAVALIALGGGSAVGAAVRYLLVSVMAAFSWLLGVAILYAETGALDLVLVGTTLEAGPGAQVALGLMMGALLLKTAVFPLHFWLPPAHASAPALASALLSAVVVKATFVLALRVWLQVFPVLSADAAGVAIGVLGAVAVLWGAAQALRQQRLKLVVAWSTVAQVGYLFLAFPMLRGDTSEAALSGSLLFAASHALAKAAMFLSAGAVLHAVGTDRLEDLVGLARRLPLTVFTFGLAGVTLMGLPPSGGFVGKWVLLGAAIGGGPWWIVVVLFAGGLLAAAYVFRILEIVFRSPTDDAPPLSAPRGAEVAALLLASAALVLGPFSRLPLLLASAFPGGAP